MRRRRRCRRGRRGRRRSRPATPASRSRAPTTPRLPPAGAPAPPSSPPGAQTEIFVFSKRKDRTKPKRAPLSDRKSCARGGSPAAMDGVDLYGARRDVASLSSFRHRGAQGGVRLCSIRVTGRSRYAPVPGLICPVKAIH